MKEYVVGFPMNLERSHIVLVQKTKPDYLRGMWNGPGGKVEEGEIPHEAMMRELREETGLSAVVTMEHAFIEMIASREGESDWRIWFFEIRLPHADLEEARQQPGEELVAVRSIQMLDRRRLVPNLCWIIPYMLDDYRTEHMRLLAYETWPRRF